MNQYEVQQREPLVIGEIPKDRQDQRGWEVVLNDEVVPDVRSLRLTHTQMGVRADYGLRPEGYDGLAIHEQEGGGSVTIPYLLSPDGRIYVGVVRQDRTGAGGVIDNVPRGFVDPGQTHDQTAAKELREETGLRAVFSRFINLGNGVNVNTAYFDTSRTASTGELEGTAFYALPIELSEVEAYEGPNGTEYRFNERIQQEAIGDEAAEGIVGSRFVPLHEAVFSSPDGYTSIAAGRLMAHLMGHGVLQVAGVQMMPPRAD